MIAALAADPFTARTTWPLSDRQRILRADTGRIRRREVRATLAAALSADPISSSPTERPLTPPNQQSLTREDTDAHCFSLEVTHGELDERGEVARLIRVTHKFSLRPAIEDAEGNPGISPLGSPLAPLCGGGRGSDRRRQRGGFATLTSSIPRPLAPKARTCFLPFLGRPAPKARIRASTSFESSLISL
jgi:hypothetical protein